MKKDKLNSHPEQFLLSPLICLVPSKGKISRLDILTPSLYARYEGVANEIKELVSSGAGRDEAKQFALEESMLRVVLDWLAIKPTKN